MDTQTDARLAYRPADAAERLGISLRSLQRHRAEGRIEFVKLGHRLLVTEDELRRFLATAQAA